MLKEVQAASCGEIRGFLRRRKTKEIRGVLRGEKLIWPAGEMGLAGGEMQQKKENMMLKFHWGENLNGNGTD